MAATSEALTCDRSNNFLERYTAGLEFTSQKEFQYFPKIAARPNGQKAGIYTALSMRTESQAKKKVIRTRYKIYDITTPVVVVGGNSKLTPKRSTLEARWGGVVSSMVVARARQSDNEKTRDREQKGKRPVGRIDITGSTL